MATEWHDRSFFLEVKPRTDLASLFVDCPPNGDGEDKENNCLDVVRVSENMVELGLPTVLHDQSLAKGDKYSARISGVFLSPNSVCSPTWADNKRLFMCKVRAGPDGNQSFSLVPKQFHKLAKEMSPVEPLEAFVTGAQGKSISITCNRCQFKVVDEKKGILSMGYLPTDDWMQTTPSIDYYCRDSCGAACDPERHGKHRNGVESQNMNSSWEATPLRLMISNSFVVVHIETARDHVTVEDKQILCSGCHAQLGTMVPNKSNLLTIHHSTCTLTAGAKSFLEERFEDRSMFFTQMLLTCCETKSSLKLVVRSLDKAPHLLVWLLDSYVLLASGDLREVKKEENQSAEVKPFPAIKMLYKVFDSETAANDPRANGEDASVGLVDLPLPCCLQLIETLLRSSHALPPACRSVGQFYVGFLRLTDSV